MTGINKLFPSGTTQMDKNNLQRKTEGNLTSLLPNFRQSEPPHWQPWNSILETQLP